MKNRVYLCIDLKSFFASVECVERGLDPLKTNLVVADAERTEKTICLAVTPSLKSYGLSGRARLFEVVAKVREAASLAERKLTERSGILDLAGHIKRQIEEAKQGREKFDSSIKEAKDTVNSITKEINDLDAKIDENGKQVDSDAYFFGETKKTVACGSATYLLVDMVPVAYTSEPGLKQ